MPNDRGNGQHELTPKPAPHAPVSPGPLDEVLDALQRDRVLSTWDQTSSEADQNASDADQGSSLEDQVAASQDQVASDNDQAAADGDLAAEEDRTPVREQQSDRSRDMRDDAAAARYRHGVQPGGTAADRVRAGTVRDRTADARNDVAEARDDHADRLLRASQSRESSLLGQLEELRGQARAERARAAADRARAADEREQLMRERVRLEDELKEANWRFDALDRAVSVAAGDGDDPADAPGDPDTADDLVERTEQALDEAGARRELRRTEGAS